MTPRQVTYRLQPHILTNAHVWSSDSQWIVYDVRSPGHFDGRYIEQVHVKTGDVQRLYTTKNDAFCGVVTYHPRRPEVVFILGPEHPGVDWTYAASRRRGVTVNVGEAARGTAVALDAMNYGEPFVAGALRGGSHVHMFSPDGEWISFTYDDALLTAFDADPHSPPHDPNSRAVAVGVPLPVKVASTHPRSHEGSYFSFVATRLSTEPLPGSDEISKAFEEGWIGQAGYLRLDGHQQLRAIAFQGMVTAKNGTQHAEVFVVDLPEDVVAQVQAMIPSPATRRLEPPPGVRQRRLTFTDDRFHPGLAVSPRHWLRSAPDGAAIAFLMKDDLGIVQLWTISPNGGEPRQVTFGEKEIGSSFTWSPDGKFLAHVMDGSVCVTEMASGTTRRLTSRNESSEGPQPQACVFSPDGQWIAYMEQVETEKGRFSQVFVVPAK